MKSNSKIFLTRCCIINHSDTVDTFEQPHPEEKSYNEIVDIHIDSSNSRYTLAGLLGEEVSNQINADSNTIVLSLGLRPNALIEKILLAILPYARVYMDEKLASVYPFHSLNVQLSKGRAYNGYIAVLNKEQVKNDLKVDVKDSQFAAGKDETYYLFLPMREDSTFHRNCMSLINK